MKSADSPYRQRYRTRSGLKDWVLLSAIFHGAMLTVMWAFAGSHPRNPLDMAGAVQFTLVAEASSQQNAAAQKAKFQTPKPPEPLKPEEKKPPKPAPKKPTVETPQAKPTKSTVPQTKAAKPQPTPSASPQQSAPVPAPAAPATQLASAPGPVDGVVAEGQVADFYLAQIKRKVMENWAIPSYISASSDNEVTIYFRILKSGQVADVRVEKPCQDKTLELSAWAAVKRAEPFLPLPNDYKDDVLGIHLVFKLQGNQIPLMVR